MYYRPLEFRPKNYYQERDVCGRVISRKLFDGFDIQSPEDVFAWYRVRFPELDCSCFSIQNVPASCEFIYIIQYAGKNLGLIYETRHD